MGISLLCSTGHRTRIRGSRGCVAARLPDTAVCTILFPGVWLHQPRQYFFDACEP